jgi:hypothetical protein
VNKELLLDWVLEDAEKNEDHYRPESRSQVAPYELLLEDMRSLGGDKIALPSSLPSTPGRMISRLRSHFKDNVTLISRVLNYHLPDQYHFYRVSKLEEEIFMGFDFFSSIVPEFDFSFPTVGRKGFERYLAVNEALLACFRRGYPELKNPQARIAWFVYEGLGRLFLEESEHRRYWVQVTGEDYFEALDSDNDLNWSARKGVRAGDLVFIYRTAPRSAITDVFEVTNDSYFEPWGEWDRFWMDMSRMCRTKDITFAELKNDGVLGEWGAVRKRFQGIVVESMPPSIYNRLLEKIPRDLCTLHDLEPEPTASEGLSGRFAIEADFADQVIEPLLRQWDFRFEREYKCQFFVGSQAIYGRIDFLVSDGRGPITLFENKRKILDEKALNLAVEQGKSYALMLGLPSFVVASPEGLWIYSLSRNLTNLEKHVSTDDLKTEDGQIRSTLLSLRASQ